VPGVPEEPARIGDIEIAYDTAGERSDPPMLLIWGSARS
jgi:hypothetical protein